MGEREALTTYTYTSTSGIELIETPAGLLVSKLEANNAGRSAYAAGVELGDRLVSFGQHPLPLYHREQILFIEKDLHTKNLQRTMRFSKRLPLIPELKHLSSCAVTPTVESLERQFQAQENFLVALRALYCEVISGLDDEQAVPPDRVRTLLEVHERLLVASASQCWLQLKYNQLTGNVDHTDSAEDREMEIARLSPSAQITATTMLHLHQARSAVSMPVDHTHSLKHSSSQQNLHGILAAMSSNSVHRRVPSSLAFVRAAVPLTNSILQPDPGVHRAAVMSETSLKQTECSTTERRVDRVVPTLPTINSTRDMEAFESSRGADFFAAHEMQQKQRQQRNQHDQRKRRRITHSPHAPKASARNKTRVDYTEAQSEESDLESQVSDSSANLTYVEPHIGKQYQVDVENLPRREEKDTTLDASYGLKWKPPAPEVLNDHDIASFLRELEAPFHGQEEALHELMCCSYSTDNAKKELKKRFGGICPPPRNAQLTQKQRQEFNILMKKYWKEFHKIHENLAAEADGVPLRIQDCIAYYYDSFKTSENGKDMIRAQKNRK